jgi:hypothetical protein
VVAYHRALAHWHPFPRHLQSHAAHLEPHALQQGFRNWFAAIASVTKGELIARDGTTLRKSTAKAWGQAAVQMVSA